MLLERDAAADRVLAGVGEPAEETVGLRVAEPITVLTGSGRAPLGIRAGSRASAAA